MTPFETLAFIYVCSQADTRTGIWKGSAGALVGELGFEPRTARDVLERLERDGYIRRFTVPGSHLCYPILVHKFLITNGQHNGEQIDAASSTFVNSYVKLAFFSREEHVEVDGKVNGEVDVEVNASQKRSEKRERKREKRNKGRAAATAKPAAAPPQGPIADARQKFINRLEDSVRLQFWLYAQGHDEELKLEFSRQFHKSEALTLGIDWREYESLYNQAVDRCNLEFTPAERITVKPIPNPITPAYLSGLVMEDESCVNAFIEDGFAYLEYEHGIAEFRPGADEPYWFAFDNPEVIQEVTRSEPMSELALPSNQI